MGTRQVFADISGSREKLERLHAEIGPHVSKRVTFFLAACQHGGIG
jgi:hypothetical protein